MICTPLCGGSDERARQQPDAEVSLLSSLRFHQGSLNAP
jgi:hypothetical protein